MYVEVYLEGADGREHELGNFTFFGEIGDAGRRVFAFPMDDLTSEVAHVRASMNPFDANNGDVSDVRVDLQAWIGMR